MKRNDGGTAYPVQLNGDVWSGMTMRQYYKSVALMGINQLDVEDVISEEVLANWCGMMADAMIAEDNRHGS